MHSELRNSRWGQARRSSLAPKRPPRVRTHRLALRPRRFRGAGRRVSGEPLAIVNWMRDRYRVQHIILDYFDAYSVCSTSTKLIDFHQFWSKFHVHAISFMNLVEAALQAWAPWGRDCAHPREPARSLRGPCGERPEAVAQPGVEAGGAGG